MAYRKATLELKMFWLNNIFSRNPQTYLGQALYLALLVYLLLNHFHVVVSTSPPQSYLLFCINIFIENINASAAA